VKITPAHDPNDYEIGKRHHLPFITIFDDEGKMLDNCEQFSVSIRDTICNFVSNLHFIAVITIENIVAHLVRTGRTLETKEAHPKIHDLKGHFRSQCVRSLMTTILNCKGDVKE
jgi:valyl-tRNA synthetase